LPYLAEAGAAVVVADVIQSAAFKFARQLEEEGYQAIGSGVDVTCPESTQGMVEQT